MQIFYILCSTGDEVLTLQSKTTAIPTVLPPSPHPPPPLLRIFHLPLCRHLRSELRESRTGPRSTSRKQPFFENCLVPCSPKFDSLFIHFNIMSFLLQSFSCVAWGQVSVMSIPSPQVTTSDAAINGLESHMYKLLLTN